MAGRKIGLVIGTNNYSDPKLSNLRFAVKDAEEIRAVLLNPDIGGFDGIVPLVDEAKGSVKKGIEKLLLKDATFDDLVLIYFSGHGKLDFNFRLNLLLKDTETDYLLSTALQYDFITNCIEQSKCKKVVIILDCCHGGAAGIKGDGFVKTLSETSGSGTFVLSATTGADLAKEVQEFENGIFTHFLLEGLKNGEADLGDDGLIDILELYEYASKKCKDEYSQVTTIKSEFEEKIVICRNPHKMRENEYILNKSKLLEEFSTQLHPRILSESLAILKKNYQNPSSLEHVDIKIYGFLISLLKGEFLVDSYSDAVQYLKGIDISSERTLSSYKVNASKPFTQIKNVQRSSFQQVEYQSDAWSNQKYFLIQMFGEKCIPLKSDSKNKLAILVIESPSEDEKYALRTGEILDLGQGYGFEVKQIDIAGENVWLEFTKDGKRVNDGIVSVVDGSGGTWNVELDDIQGVNNVVVFKVHINQIFQGAVDRIVEIDGLWLIDYENSFTINSGDEFNGYEIMEINDEYISYKSLDNIL